MPCTKEQASEEPMAFLSGLGSLGGGGGGGANGSGSGHYYAQQA